MAIMDDTQDLILGIATAVIGLAIVAVIFSPRSNTSGVVAAAGNAFGGILGVAVSPITGGSPGGFGGFTPQPQGGPSINFPGIQLPTNINLPQMPQPPN